MTKEEFKTKSDILEKQHKENKLALYKDYAFSNNPHKKGDIITDRIGRIKIEKISVSVSYNGSIAECIYSGPELTAKLVPFKNVSTRTVHQSNIVKS